MHSHQPGTRRCALVANLKRAPSWVKYGALGSILILAFAALSAARGQTISRSASPIIIRGTLGAIAGKGPVLVMPQKEYALNGQSPYLLHVLEDKRLVNQELQLEGTPGPGGSFVVSRIYAVRDGKLYKIQYYCQVCNIIYVQPGHCYCCGRETELQEVPVKPANP
ncbi:MAG TPA: hypothetical protein VGX94_15360 [Terriglobia bacterium]|nr:hypothetical protein [Terriglobia bacterium]